MVQFMAHPVDSVKSFWSQFSSTWRGGNS